MGTDRFQLSIYIYKREPQTYLGDKSVLDSVDSSLVFVSNRIISKQLSNERPNQRMNEWTNEWTNERTNERTNETDGTQTYYPFSNVGLLLVGSRETKPLCLDY